MVNSPSLAQSLFLQNVTRTQTHPLIHSVYDYFRNILIVEQRHQVLDQPKSLKYFLSHSYRKCAELPLDCSLLQFEYGMSVSGLCIGVQLLADGLLESGWILRTSTQSMGSYLEGFIIGRHQWERVEVKASGAQLKVTPIPQELYLAVALPVIPCPCMLSAMRSAAFAMCSHHYNTRNQQS